MYFVFTIVLNFQLSCFGLSALYTRIQCHTYSIYIETVDPACRPSIPQVRHGSVRFNLGKKSNHPLLFPSCFTFSMDTTVLFFISWKGAGNTSKYFFIAHLRGPNWESLVGQHSLHLLFWAPNTYWKVLLGSLHSYKTHDDKYKSYLIFLPFYIIYRTKPTCKTRTTQTYTNNKNQ